MTASELLWHEAEVTAVAEIIEPVRAALACRADDQSRALGADLEIALDILRQEWPGRAGPEPRATSSRRQRNSF